MSTRLFLIGGVLVFFTAAGFAMLGGGLDRSKNVTMQMVKTLFSFSWQQSLTGPLVATVKTTHFNPKGPRIK